MKDSKHLDFDSWYRANHARVLAGVRIVADVDQETAEEATQLAFVKALERWKRVQKMGSPVGWTVRVGVNNARSALSKQKKRRSIEAAQNRDSPAGHFDLYEDTDLWNTVLALPEKQRMAIVLRYIEDLTQAEIAARLDVQPGTVAATLHQARAGLRASTSKEIS